jgi:hypothetical protein
MNEDISFDDISVGLQIRGEVLTKYIDVIERRELKIN